MTIPSAISGPGSFVVTSAIYTDHTLQALVELNYMRVGNEVMSGALSKLEQALSITQQSLDVLTSVQTMHNQIAVTAPGSFPFSFQQENGTVTTTQMTNVSGVMVPMTGTLSYDDADSYMKAYLQVASGYFGEAIAPFFQVKLPATATRGRVSATITGSGQPEYQVLRSMLMSAKSEIASLITALSTITAEGDRTTLLSQLKTVYNNMPSDNYTSIKNWVIDSYGQTNSSGVTKAGDFQQNITNAITAAQSSNTSQNEAVRRYMFVFEQYTQSAAAILSTLNQILQKITRGISG